MSTLVLLYKYFHKHLKQTYHKRIIMYKIIKHLKTLIVRTLVPPGIPGGGPATGGQMCIVYDYIFIKKSK